MSTSKTEDSAVLLEDNAAEKSVDFIAALSLEVAPASSSSKVGEIIILKDDDVTSESACSLLVWACAIGMTIQQHARRIKKLLQQAMDLMVMSIAVLGKYGRIRILEVSFCEEVRVATFYYSIIVTTPLVC